MSPEALTLSDAVLFSCIAAALVLASAQFLDSGRAFDRVLFGSILIVMLLNYCVYRVQDTLPPFQWSAYAIWPRIYFGFECLVVLYTLLSIVFFFRRTDHSAAADASERAVAGMASPPAVDILICTYNEELVILERTILAARMIDYPSFTVWVLDDGRRDWLQDFCAEVGVRYVRRASNEGAKGGNLNNGLRISAEQTNAPYILILDADFAPQRKILKRVIGQFDDASIGLIQTPQFYYNADPVQHNLLADLAWVDDQRIFFDVMQPSKDGWGAAFCVGTSCVVRRDALDAIGGMPSETVTEDIHLSYRLMQKGLRTRWLNERLSVGLSAESLSGYITQRCRWCLGTIQVALLRDGPFLGRGYTFTQRLHYLHGLLFWFCRPFMLLLLSAPIFYYFLGLPAILMEPAAFFLYAFPTVMAMWAFHAWVSDRRSLPLFTEVSQMVAAFPITVAIAHAIWKPFGRPFKVTAKGEDRSRVQIMYPLAAMFLAIIVLTLLGMINGPLLRTYDDLDSLSIAWGIVVMIYSFVSMMVCVELPRPAVENVRFPTSRASRLAYRTGETTACTIEGVSASSIGVSGVKLSGQSNVGELVGCWPLEGLSGIGRIATVDPAAGILQIDLVAVKEDRAGGPLLTSPDEVRRTVIGHLYSDVPHNVAARARPFAAVTALLRRAFGSPASVMRAPAAREPTV